MIDVEDTILPAALDSDGPFTIFLAFRVENLGLRPKVDLH